MQEIKAAGSAMLDTGLGQLVTAMSNYRSANASFSPLTATLMPTDTSLQNALPAAWHH